MHELCSCWLLNWSEMCPWCAGDRLQTLGLSVFRRTSDGVGHIQKGTPLREVHCSLLAREEAGPIYTRKTVHTSHERLQIYQKGRNTRAESAT